MRKCFKAFAIGFLSLFATLGVTACEFDTEGTTTKTTTTAKPTTTDRSSNRYKIKTSGVVSGLTITPKINGEAIDLSKDYPIGSKIDVDITNTTNKYYRITASMANKKYKAKWVDWCYDASDPEDIKHAELNGIELLDDLTLSVKEVDGDDYVNVALSIDDSKDTATLTNTVKVFEPNTWEVPYENGDEAVEGQKLTVVLYNYASDTTILVRKSGTILKQQKYNQLEPNADGYVISTFTIENDCEEVYIETDCKEEAGIDARVVNTMYDSTGVTYKLYDDGVEIESGTTIESNSVITCEVTNGSDNDIIATTYLAGGDDLEAFIVSKGTSKTLSKTATNSVMFAIELYTEHKVTYSSSISSVTMTVKDKDNSDILSNSDVARYSKINLSITNPDSVDYSIKIKMRDDYYDEDMIDKTIILTKNSTWTPEGDFLLYGDLTISVVSVEKYILTINNPFDEDHADVFSSILDPSSSPVSGDQIDDGVELSFVIMFDTTNYKVTLTNGSETILDNEIPNNTFYTINGFVVKGNVTLTIVAK